MPYIVIAATTTILLRIFTFERNISRFSAVALVRSSLIAFTLFWILLICRKRIVYLQNCMMQLIVGPMIRSITLTLFVSRNMCMRGGTIIRSSRKYDKTFLILSKILEWKEEEGETGHAPIGLRNSSTYLVAYFKSSSAFVTCDVFSMLERLDKTDYVSVSNWF